MGSLDPCTTVEGCRLRIREVFDRNIQQLSSNCWFSKDPLVSSEITAHDSPIPWPSLAKVASRNYPHRRQRAFQHIIGSLGGRRTRRMSRYGSHHRRPKMVEHSGFWERTTCFPRWWQLKYFLFSPLPGEIIQFDEHIFPMGWFNHQLVPAPHQKSAGWKNLKERIFCGQPVALFVKITSPLCYAGLGGGEILWKILWNQQEIRKETKATPV